MIMLNSALNYAKKGWYVFPVSRQSKKALISEWQHKATTNPQQIVSWWGQWKDANIGVLAGKSNLAIVDIDQKNGRDGYESWLDLIAELELGPQNTIQSTTPSGGTHIFYHCTDDVGNGRADVLGMGLDIRAGRSYAILPPSEMSTGVYAWETADGELAPLPDKLKALLVADKVKAAPTIPPGKISEGQRNTLLTSLAGSMRRRGASESAILAALEVENERCEPPLSTDELRQIAKSVARYRPTTQSIGARLSSKQVERVKAMVPESPDPEFKVRIFDTLVAAGYEKGQKPSPTYRRRDAAEMLLEWLNEHGGFVQGEVGELYYFSHTGKQLYSMETDRWRAWLYALTGANPAGTDYAYLAADCKASAIFAPRRQVVRVAAWDDENQVLRVSRFDGTVYVLDGKKISEEPNGQNVIFDDDPLWTPYEPDFSGPGALRWATSELPNFDGDGLGLAYRAWVIGTFFCELCPTRPLLVFLGEKGSGKSMALRVLLQLLFGPIAQLSGVPDRPDGFTAAAAAAHIYAIDNLDQFTGWLRDKLSRIATGAKDEYRRLYTSNERGQVIYRCWLAFTARTPDTLRRDDLADRLLLLPVKRIGNDARQPERDFLAQAVALRSWWWGDVLTVLNSVVASIRQGMLANTSTLRMADWESLGRLVAKCEEQEETWDTFVKDLERSQSNFLLEGDLIIDALDEWLKIAGNPGRKVTAKDLHGEWTLLLFGDKKPPKDWYTSTRGLGMKLANNKHDLEKFYHMEWENPRGRSIIYQFWSLEE